MSFIQKSNSQLVINLTWLTISLEFILSCPYNFYVFVIIFFVEFFDSIPLVINKLIHASINKNPFSPTEAN